MMHKARVISDIILVFLNYERGSSKDVVEHEGVTKSQREIELFISIWTKIEPQKDAGGEMCLTCSL